MEASETPEKPVPQQSRLKRLFLPRKWPGWAFFLKWASQYFPDWFGRISFWIDTAKTMSGHLGTIAKILAAPSFNLFLGVLGIGYLVFVGEPKRVVRSPIFVFFGWASAVAIAVLLIIILTAGYVAVHLPQQQQQETTKKLDAALGTNDALNRQVRSQAAQIAHLQQLSQWRVVTDSQRAKLAELIQRAPTVAGNYKLHIDIVSSCGSECMGYGGDLLASFEGLDNAEEGAVLPVPSKLKQWTVTAGINPTLNVRLLGLLIPLDATRCPANEFNWILEGLQVANIPYTTAELRSDQEADNVGFHFGECHMIVGNNG